MRQKKFSGSFEVLPSYKELEKDVRTLMEEAIIATEKSYSPYSSFAVGAAVRMSDGRIIRGSNQENMSFPAGLCAERVVLHRAVEEFPEKEIEMLAITARSQSGWVKKPVTPCGICRQTMLEVVRRQKKSFSLYLGTKDRNTFYVPKAEFLLPLSFFNSDLKK